MLEENFSFLTDDQYLRMYLGWHPICDRVICQVQCYISNRLSDKLCLYMAYRQYVMQVKGFSGSPRGGFAGYHLTFLLTPCPQDSQDRKVPAVPVLGQHLLVIAWINIDGCHGRGCLLWLPGRGTWDSGGGRNGHSGEKWPVNAIPTVNHERMGVDKELLGLGLLFLWETALTNFGKSRFSWLQFAFKGEETRPTISHIPSCTPSPRGSLSRGGGAVTENKPEIRRQNGDEDFVRLGRSNTGAWPPISGKETAAAPRCAGVLTTQEDRNGLNDRNHGRSRGAAGAPRGGRRGGGEERRREEGEKGRREDLSDLSRNFFPPPVDHCVCQSKQMVPTKFILRK